MDPKKKKLVNIPESKGLLHNFKFSTEIPFAPLAYPKTLYYQLDSDRHTRARTVNAEVKNMCNLLVSYDLGLAIDDLNMKPHVYNLQVEEDTAAGEAALDSAVGSVGTTQPAPSSTQLQLHPDDLALINEDIVVSDTEEDEQSMKIREENRKMEELIEKNTTELNKQRGKDGNILDLKNETQTDFTVNFETLKLAILDTFTASKHTTIESLRHPTKPELRATKIFDVFPTTLQKAKAQPLKLGVTMHKQKIKGINDNLDKGKFSCLYKDISLLNKNQNLMRLFTEKPQQNPAKAKKTVFEEDSILIDPDYEHFFEEDPEVQIEQEGEEEVKPGEQLRLKNQSMFMYTDHTLKLQKHDQMILFKRNCEDPVQKAYYQKIEFQYSLDQEKRDLIRDLVPNANDETQIPRYVTMNIIDEEKLRLEAKRLAEEQAAADRIEEESDGDYSNGMSGNGSARKNRVNPAKSSNHKYRVGGVLKVAKNKKEEEDDDDVEDEIDDEDEDDDDFDEENSEDNEQVLQQKPKSSRLAAQQIKAKNSTDQMKRGGAQKNHQQQEEEDNDDSAGDIDDIFGEKNTTNEVVSSKTVKEEKKGTNKRKIEDEEEEEEEFQFGKKKPEEIVAKTIINVPQQHHLLQQQQQQQQQQQIQNSIQNKPSFIDKEDSDEGSSCSDSSDEDDDDDKAIQRKKEKLQVLQALQKQRSQQLQPQQKPQLPPDHNQVMDEEFPI